MFLSEQARDVIAYGGWSLGIVGVIATIVLARRAAGRVLWRWAPIACLPFGLGASCWSHRFDAQVLVVRDGHSVYGKRAIARELAAGEPDRSYAPGADYWGGSVDPLWVVNDSSRPVRVEPVRYGAARGNAPGVLVLPPGTKAAYASIDSIGTEFDPPGEVREIDLGQTSAIRYHLTWDDD